MRTVTRLLNEIIDDCSDECSIESLERKLDVERKLASLTELERRIVLLYAEGYSQQEIGERVGYSRRNIGNILENIAKSIVDNTLI